MSNLGVRLKIIIGKLFGKYLFYTNTITSGILMGAGDIIQQEIEIYRHRHKGPKFWRRYDWHRINTMFWVGLAQGPPQHVLYGLVDQWYPKRDYISITKKILFDQTVVSPVCLTIFFVGCGVLEHQSVQEIIAETRQKFLTCYIMDWALWPPAQFINFYYLPPQYRVMYVHFLTMLYDVFLSYVKYDAEFEEEERKVGDVKSY